MTRPPVEVRDASGAVVARITVTPTQPPPPDPVRGWRAVRQLLVFIAVCKLVAWLLFLSFAAR